MTGSTRISALIVIAAALAVFSAATQLSPRTPAPALAQAPNVCGPNPSPSDPADPSIRVWEPTTGAHAAGSVRVAGLARVFEANVSLQLRNAAGQVIAAGFTTAQQAGPVLAPFSGALPFNVNAQTPACLWAFEESAQDGSPRNVVQIPVTLVPANARYVQATLDLGELRPCIPAAGQAACDATRLALWNGDAQAWAARGVTNPDARFNETVVFRVQQGDPVAIRNIARILGWPYLQITALNTGDEPFVQTTNLGGGAQNVAGWTVRSPDRNAVVALPAGLVLGPDQTCRVYSGGVVRADSCGGVSFAAQDVWPDAGGRAVLYADPIDLPAADTRYSAVPAMQPPPPNLQGSILAAGVPGTDAFEFTLSTPQSAYAQGEGVPFQMTLRNLTNQQLSLTFLGGQDFDIVVQNEADANVWRWSTGRAFTLQLRDVTFAPGETRQFNATWDQQSDGGQQVPAGAYRATATTATQTVITSNAVAFRIDAATPGAIEFQLSLPRQTFARGESIEFQMVARNRSNQPQTVEFPTGQDFEIVVQTEAGQAVWRYSTGRAFTQVFRTITHQPGEERTFAHTWDQRADAGQMVSPGTSRATATLTTTNPIQSNAVTFRIDPSPPSATFEFMLSTPRSAYRTGETVPFEMVLRNVTNQPRELTFRSGQDFDIVVQNEAGQELWRWSTGRAFSQQIREITFAPGEERRFDATWDQQSDAGMQVPPASYQAVATLTIDDPVQSNAVTIVIQ
jgi:hypothetical protein